MSETIGYIEHGTAEDAETAAFEEQEARAPRRARVETISLLDELTEAAEEDLAVRNFFEIKGRKGEWSAEFDCIISESEIKRYDAKAMGKKKKREDLSRRTLAAYILQEKCLGLYKGTGADRKLVEDGEGDPLTFRSEVFHQMMKHPNDGFAAILTFLGDAQAITMSSAVLREGGWSEDLTPLDPTEG